MKFDQARSVDPFRIEAYQGSFTLEEIKRVSALRSRAKPAWDRFIQTSPNQDTVEQLEQLSAHLQAAGLHELGLLVRQLVVAHRESTYNKDDLQFIKTSLQALMPEGDFEEVLKGLENSQQGPGAIEPYDGRCEAPFPPTPGRTCAWESSADVMDQTVWKQKGSNDGPRSEVI